MTSAGDHDKNAFRQKSLSGRAGIIVRAPNLNFFLVTKKRFGLLFGDPWWSSMACRGTES
jgi:hypothetical protein